MLASRKLKKERVDFVTFLKCFFFIAAKLSAERSYIAVLLVFYNSKNLNCIGVLSFLRLEEEYWRSPFYNSKNLNCIGALSFF